MGKCIITGYETSVGLKIKGKEYVLAPAIKDMVLQAIKTPDYEVRNNCLLRLKAFETQYDKDNIESVNELLSIIEKLVNNVKPNEEQSEKEKKTIIKSKGTFEPPLGKYFLRMLGIGLGSILTFGLLAPWFIILEEKWECQYLTIDGNPVHFDAPVGQYYLKCIVWALLTIVTFTIFGIFVPVYSRRWMNEYMFIDNDDKKVTE